MLQIYLKSTGFSQDVWKLVPPVVGISGCYCASITDVKLGAVAGYTLIIQA